MVGATCVGYLGMLIAMKLKRMSRAYGSVAADDNFETVGVILST